MVPILFESTEQTFTSNGLGKLTDAIKCVVTEERNGVFELEMQYPLDGLHYSDITYDRIIFCRTCDAVAMQPFRIYKISRPLSGIVTIYARHISYDLNKIVVAPFTEPSITQLFANLPDHTFNNCPFTFLTDKTVTADFNVVVPSTIRSLLGGSEGSVLDVYGTGEYKFDKFNVYLYLHRGQDNGVTIRYGKNLTDLKKDDDISGSVTAVVPYWQDADGNVVSSPEIILSGIGRLEAYANEGGNEYNDEDADVYQGVRIDDTLCTPLDLSDKFETEPTVAQLQAAALDWLDSHATVTPDENITISFAHLWQTNEYKNYAPLQRVNLCDTVTVIYTKLGVSATAKVIKTVYDVLLERYNSIELGTPRTTLSDTIIKTEAAIKEVEKTAVTSTFMEEAISAATDLITGGQGGHVVLKKNANGQPEEILIMNTADMATAMNVLRMNQNGIGFSTNGINGPFTTAWTINGAFVADFITAGTLKTIKLEGPTADTFWDLATGIWQSHGSQTVTAQVETSQGTYTPVTYNITTDVNISGGSYKVKGTTSGETTDFAEFGIAADGMNYDYYDAQNGDAWSSKSYPYSRLVLTGGKIDGYADDVTDYSVTAGKKVTYNPRGTFAPDRIMLGDPVNVTAEPGVTLPAQYGVDRNTLELKTGWGAAPDSIIFREYYQYEYDSDAQMYYKNFRAVPVRYAPVWSCQKHGHGERFVPDDTTGHVTWAGSLVVVGVGDSEYISLDKVCTVRITFRPTSQISSGNYGGIIAYLPNVRPAASAQALSAVYTTSGEARYAIPAYVEEYQSDDYDPIAGTGVWCARVCIVPSGHAIATNGFVSVSGSFIAQDWDDLDDE